MKWRMVRLALVGLLAAAVLPVLGAGVVWWVGWDERTGVCDVALVLGNAVSPEGVVSERLRSRLDRAVALYRAGLIKKIIASGGVDSSGTDEARHMARYLFSCGIPEEVVVVHNGGYNSYLSARFAAMGVREGRWGCVTVVSQFYHVPRVRMAMALFGTPALYWARPNYLEKGDFYRLLREFFACLRYLFHDYSLPSGENNAGADDRVGGVAAHQSLFPSEGVFGIERHAYFTETCPLEAAFCGFRVGCRYVVCDGVFCAGCILVSGAQGQKVYFSERAGNRSRS